MARIVAVLLITTCSYSACTLVSAKEAALSAMSYQQAPQKVTVQRLVEQANAVCAHGDMTRAMTLYNQIIQTHPTEPAAYLGRGHLKVELGKTAEGLQDLDLAVKYDPKMANLAIRDRADLLQNMHKYQEAIRDYTVLIEKIGWDSYHHDRGHCYAMLNKPQLAIADFNTALSKKGCKRYAILIKRGDAYLKLKQYDKALADYDAVLKEDPESNRSRDNYAHVHEGKAEIYKRQGKLDLAKKETATAKEGTRELMDLAPFASGQK